MKLKKEYSNLYAALDQFVEVAMPNTDALNRSPVINSLWNFLLDAAKKIESIQSERGEKLADRDLESEIRQKTLDIFWLNEAKTWNKSK